MKEVWLVYRPAHGYEESEQPYFCCLSEAIAKACAKRMNDYANSLHNRLPYLPNVPSCDLPDNHVEQIAFERIWSKFESIRDKARWPYGINLFNDRETGEIIHVKPLQIRSKP